MSSEPIPTSVYVHFPWCARKCPYCDFATEPVKTNTIAHGAYADALLRELDSRAADLQERMLVSVFFGGGTPSLWNPSALARTLSAIRGAFDVESNDLEVTVECNPSSLSRAHAAALVNGGVNRVSIGVQSLRDVHLGFLGRLHDAAQAVRAVEDAFAEVPRVSADLMFGMPEQSKSEFAEDIRRLLEVGVRHVSAYALTIEHQTLFGSLQKAGKLRVATDDRYADLFERAQAEFSDAGWDHYEVSNYAVRGEESRHNMHYWQGGAYVGLGSSAVGCLEEGVGAATRWRNEPIPQRYMSHPEAGGTLEALDADHLIREALMLGLRTLPGVNMASTAQRAGRDVSAGREVELERALRRGDVALEDDWLRVPQDRWLKLDGIVRDLF
ncbi:MAG: radical SAM family heme chaperone HemW [Myxococcota bacterium]